LGEGNYKRRRVVKCELWADLSKLWGVPSYGLNCAIEVMRLDAAVG